jgi:integrase
MLAGSGQNDRRAIRLYCRRKAATLHVRRVKNGTPATRPLIARAPPSSARKRQIAVCLCVGTRCAAFSPWFLRMVERTAICAKLGIKAHAHMLRHACGYKLANDGRDTRSLQAYLGHKNIQNTTRYTALAPDRVKNFWKD